ncbi:hypothetical protein LCGC14_1551960 [marine sediment metagenome]|uniref:Uncharacterized protein n=1 Tax=marine sediment metagenome TaxID=412755 RepID=A0A0F9IPY0_9ZZZZ|nr:hypothetical protein [Candidatus Scalindua sp.]
MFRIIDNKKISLTEDEFALYQKIATSYDRPNFQGKDLFKGLFETDDNGIIVFLRPPAAKYTSMEVYMFLISIMVHQHLGIACEHVDKLGTSLAEKIKECDDVISEGKQLIKELKTSRDSSS